MEKESDQNFGQWARKYPELGTGPVPIEPCVSPEHFELERERIFKRVWLNVGRDEEIANPGDYYVKDMAVWGTSIIVMRGRDGKVRAFHNMCSHRGNKLAWDTKGNCRAITCKFHGWSYDTAGRLTGVPDEKNFFEFKRADHGLTPVATDVWEGFIFVHLDPNPKETLREYLGEVADQLEGYPFGQLSTRFTYLADERVNWKVLLDAQQEGYHLPVLHRRTFSKTIVSEESATNAYRSVAMRLYKYHRMLATSGVGDQASVLTPIETLSRRFGATTMAAMGGGTYTGNAKTVLTGSFDFWVIFPNFVLALMEGTYFTYNLWPQSVAHTLWEVRTYYPPAKNAGERFSQEYAKCTLRDPLLEDGGVHEKVQSMLASGARSHFTFQDEETLLRHGHHVVAEFVK